jgi:purine-binding chemotaxis protein CheW
MANEKDKKILKERAHALSQVITQEKDLSQQLSLIKFKVNDTIFSIEVSYVVEIYPFGHPTPLPFTPSFVLGLLNIRRKMTTVVDLLLFLQLEQKTEGNYVILLQGQGVEFGILATEMIGYYSIFPEEIKAPLITLPPFQQALLKGITLDGFAILNGDRLLGINFHG